MTEQPELPAVRSIIPPTLAERLEALADNADNVEYKIGDLAEEAFALFWEDLTAEFPHATKKWYYTGLGDLCGKSWETVRSYHYVSKNVPPSVREQFPALYRNHHKAIIPYAKGELAKHIELCEWWLSKADEYGGSVGGVTALRATLAEKEPNPTPMWARRLGRLTREAEAIKDDPEAPPVVVEFAGRILVRYKAIAEAEIARGEHAAIFDIGERKPEE